MDFLVYFFLPIVAVSTFQFARVKFIGPIRSSAIIGIVSYLISPTNVLLLYGATFVGMCSCQKLQIIDVFASGLLYGLIAYGVSLVVVSGLGGTLGFSAFLSVLVWVGLKRSVNSLKGS